MSVEVTIAEYRALAELRYRIRLFLREGDAKARAAGLEPQQYLLLLALRGLPGGADATIRTLAERMVLKHHSVVELVDRLAAHGYVRRLRSRDDRRKVLVSLLPRGVKLVERVAHDRISELRSSGVKLVTAIEALLHPKSQARLQYAAASRQGTVRRKHASSSNRGKSPRK
ncbi:MAG TPA: MarR family transcriptional regulator [Candidatus Acidoferrum sp.]|nr:MarR family transcriptional regulator [Candidatus Acidoferrum sp.]